jgi:hypothetical protein
MNQQTPPALRTANELPVAQRAARGPASTPSVGIKESQPLAVAGPAEREAMIREAAYFRAEHRAVAPGNALEDWLAAEREIDGLLALRALVPAAPC